jgi:hypothetical protein
MGIGKGKVDRFGDGSLPGRLRGWISYHVTRALEPKVINGFNH